MKNIPQFLCLTFTSLSLIFFFSCAHALMDLNSCRVLDQEGELYVLTQDIYSDTPNCMIISANNIVLDMQGLKIFGNRTNFTAIRILNDTNSIRITNGTIENATIGISSVNSLYELVNLNILNSDIGIVLEKSDAMTHNLTTIDVGMGILLNQSVIGIFNGNIEASNNTISFYEDITPELSSNFVSLYNSSVDESKIRYSTQSIVLFLDNKGISVLDENLEDVKNYSVWLNMTSIHPEINELLYLSGEESDWINLVNGPNDRDSLIYLKLIKNGEVYDFQGKQVTIKVLVNETLNYFYKIELKANYSPYETWTFILGQNISLECPNEENEVHKKHTSKIDKLSFGESISLDAIDNPNLDIDKPDPYKESLQIRVSKSEDSTDYLDRSRFIFLITLLAVLIIFLLFLIIVLIRR